MVLTQNAMLKSLQTGLVIWTELFNPLKLRQPPIRPFAVKLAPVTIPLFPRPDTSGVVLAFVAFSGQ